MLNSFKRELQGNISYCKIHLNLISYLSIFFYQFWFPKLFTILKKKSVAIYLQVYQAYCCAVIFKLFVFMHETIKRSVWLAINPKNNLKIRLVTLVAIFE